MKIYTCEGSRGLRATWAAEEIGLDYELVMMPFPPRAFAKEYFAVNPLGTVPALVADGQVMTESSGIAHYLAARHSPGNLAVNVEEPDFGPFLDYLHHADATLTFPQTVRLRFCMFEVERGLQEAGEAYGTWFGKRLIKIDQRLADRDFLCADRFTVADIAIAYALHLTDMTKLSHLLSPRLTEWLGQMRARPGFVRAVARERAGLAGLKAAG